MMKYFKNTELANLYHVSEKSVRNWIQAALEGKLDLTLHQRGDKHYIANTSKNCAIVEQLVEKGKKYKNSRGLKVVLPSEEFYKRFNEKQILDVIDNIDVHREIPYQYNYFNGGATHWDHYTQKLLNEKTTNYLTDILELLEVNLHYLDHITSDYDHINIVDIGTGNCLPIRQLIEHFIKNKKLRRYVAIDVSQDMLDIAQHHISRWFNNEVSFEGYARDINYDRFDDLVAGDRFGAKADSTINIVLFLGGTIVNFREPEHSLRNIHDSMGKNDLLLFSLRLDSGRSRRYFDFTTANASSVKGFRGKDLLNIMSIDESLYELEQYFDEQRMAREARVRFKVETSIEFRYKGQSRTIHLNKGDTLLLWRATHHDALSTLNQFDSNNFDLVHASKTKEQESILLTSRIKIANHR